MFLAAGDKNKMQGYYHQRSRGQVVARMQLGYVIFLELEDLVLMTLSNEKEVPRLLKLAEKIAKFSRDRRF